jgi:hypothetical protein
MKIEIERTASSLWISLPRNGGFWIGRQREAVTAWWKPEAEKQNGEWLFWLGRLHIIFTPPGWTAPKLPRTQGISAT